MVRGEAIRDWLHVHDNCEAIDLVLHKGTVGEIYNIGGSNEETNLDVTRAILSELGKDESYINYVSDRLGQDVRYALNSDKMHALGWKPKRSFREGLKQTAEWYKTNQEWWQKINKLVIAGARLDGHAGVVLNTLKAKNEYEVIGFLDNALVDQTVGGLPVVGETSTISPELNVEAGFVAIGNNHERKAVTKRLKNAGLKIITLIHPNAVLSENVTIGEGSFIGAGAILGDNVKIGENVLMGSGSTIEHESIISDDVHVASGVSIDTRVRIKEGAYLGIGCKVIPDVTIGKHVVVPAGTVVSSDIPDAPEADTEYTGETFYRWKKD